MYIAICCVGAHACVSNGRGDDTPTSAVSAASAQCILTSDVNLVSSEINSIRNNISRHGEDDNDTLLKDTKFRDTIDCLGRYHSSNTGFNA